MILKFETQKIKVNCTVKCSRLECLPFFIFCCKHCSSRFYLLYFKHEYNLLRSSCTTSSAQAPCKLPPSYRLQMHVFCVLLHLPFIYFLEFFFKELLVFYLVGNSFPVIVKNCQKLVIRLQWHIWLVTLSTMCIEGSAPLIAGSERNKR